MMYGFGHGWGMGWGWGLGLILVAIIIYFILRSSGSSGNTSKSAESALDILKKRYAQGEISKEEFENKKKDVS
jgi:putative membrane protein